MKITKKPGLSLNFGTVVSEFAKQKVQVGWSGDIEYPNGASVAMVATQNEFGNPSKNIPPRPFMRPTISAKKETWLNKIGQGFKAVLNEKKTTGEVFEMIGLLAAGDIRKTITTITSPALKTATVKARLKGKKQGKSVSLTIAKPLVDTGYMLSSLTSEVVSK